MEPLTFGWWNFRIVAQKVVSCHLYDWMFTDMSLHACSSLDKLVWRIALIAISVREVVAQTLADASWHWKECGNVKSFLSNPLTNVWLTSTASNSKVCEWHIYFNKSNWWIGIRTNGLDAELAICDHSHAPNPAQFDHNPFEKVQGESPGHKARIAQKLFNCTRSMNLL